MNLYIFQLDRKIRQNIKNCRYTAEELGKIKGKLEWQMKVRKKGFRRAALLVAGITVLLLGMTYTALGPSNVFWFSRAATAAMVFLVLLISWFACIGIVKHQFNHAVRTAYPEYADELSL